MNHNTIGLRHRVAWFLSLAAFFAMALPDLALGRNNAEGLPVLPLTIVNNVGTKLPLYVYIKGIVSDHTTTIPKGQWVYVSNLEGDITLIPNIKPGDYTGALALNLGTAKTTAVKFPKLNAVRIYFSFGSPPMVCCSNAVGSSPSEPAGWGKSDPNFNTLFDWAELVWDDGGNTGLGHKTRLGGNVTQVDMFGLPMELSLEGTSPSSNQSVTRNAGFTSSLQTMMSAYQQLGSPWTNLIILNTSNVPVRVVSPYHGIDLGVFPKDEMDSYIDQVFMFYSTGNSLKAKASCPQDKGVTHSLLGNTSGNLLVFKESGVPRFQFTKPNTLTVYQNEIHPEPTPQPELDQCLAGVVAAKLGGAFVRTNLLVNTDLV